MRFWVVNRQARGIVVDYSTQADRNNFDELLQFQLSSHGAVHFKQQAQAVSLPRQLLLGKTGVFEVEGVFHRDGDLARDSSEHFGILLGKGVICPADNVEGSKHPTV